MADRNRIGAPEVTPRIRKKSSFAQLASKIFFVGDEGGTSVRKHSSTNPTSQLPSTVEIMPSLVEKSTANHPSIGAHENPSFENDSEAVKPSYDELPGRANTVRLVDGKNKKQEQQSLFANVDKKKVRKMDSAIKLNKAVKEQSLSSRLVVLNLPKPPESSEALHQYMDYLEVLTEGLERVLLVRGSGKEVITIYS